jgi:two-component system sensor histidine kinase MprB
MGLRRRITLAAAAAVAVAIVLASVLSYFAVRDQLCAQVDAALRRQAAFVAREGAQHPGEPFRSEGFGRQRPGGDQRSGTGPRLPRPFLGGAAGYAQFVTPGGQTVRPPGDTIALPVDVRVRGLARGSGSTFLRDAHVAGGHVRIVSATVPGRGAVEIARPLDEVDHVLRRMRLILLVLGAAGVALAAALGWFVARTTLIPVRRLTDATEHVGATQDLGRRIEVSGSDELSRLAASFNSMLETLQRSTQALDRSVQAQRQLVADASHELRTPLTSLRTNVEVLERADSMSEGDRRKLLDDVHGQIEELTELMSDVIELARGDVPSRPTTSVRLDELVGESVQRAQRHAHGVKLRLEGEPCVVQGASERLARAVNNLLDNAIKFSPPGGEVEVTVRDGEVAIRDHGPGIPEQDLDHVFDRFFRAPEARGRPGSGLGLAIVRQVAETHGGSVRAERASGGGARLVLTLPVDRT